MFLSLDKESSLKEVLACLKGLQADSARVDKMKSMKLFGEEDIDTVLQNVKVGKLERHLEREIRKRK